MMLTCVKYVMSTITCHHIRASEQPCKTNINISILHTEKLNPRTRTGLAGGLAAARIQLSWGNPALSCHLHSILPVASGSICLWPTRPVTPEPEGPLSHLLRLLLLPQGGLLYQTAFYGSHNCITNVFPAAVAGSRLMSPWP